MAEAVGLVSGLLTMISFALKASQSLYDVVSSLKSQRQTIKDILTDLGALVTVLTKIRERAQQPAEAAKLEPIRRPLECCTTTCNEMREMVDACRTHSDDGQASVRDWLKMRYREKSFDDMKKRLSSYKTTLVVAFQSINIQDHSVTQESLLDLKGLISETKEDLEDQQDELRQIFSAADASLRKALEEDQARLQSSLDSIAQAQEIADTTQLKVVVRDICHDEGSRAIAGTDSSQQGLNLIVENIRVGVGATSSAGMYSPETLQRLLQHSSAPEVALVLQALQTQPPSGRNEALHSALNIVTAKRSQEALYTPAPGLLTEVEASDFPGLNQSTAPPQSVRAGPSRDKSRQGLAEL